MSMTTCAQRRCWSLAVSLLVPLCAEAVVLAAQPIGRTIHTAKFAGLLREVSDDGRYVAHIAEEIYRDEDGKVDLDLNVRGADHRLKGKHWRTGIIQAIQNVNDGSYAMILSQLYEEEGDPFTQPLDKAYERTLYGSDDKQNLRLPTIKPGGDPNTIRSTYLGANDLIRVAISPLRSPNNISQYNLQTHKLRGRPYEVPRIPDAWTDPQSSNPMLYNNEGFVFNQNLKCNIYDLLGKRRKPQVLDATLETQSTLFWHPGGHWFGPDDTLLANYESGLILWNFRGRKQAIVRLQSESRDRRFISLLSPELAAVVYKNGLVQLVDLKEKQVIDKAELGAEVLLTGRLQTAASGKYLCLNTDDARDLVCVKVDEQRISGLWSVGKHVLDGERFYWDFKCARLAPTLVLETNNGERSRLVIVDLDRLTQAPADVRFGD